VVLVEDEEPVRQAVERALRREGFAVTGFADYPDPGLILAAAPDLAVLDVLLPSGDGFELARELRAARDLPIVFLTARDAVEDRLDGFGLGADDYLVKPFDFGELLARIHAVMRRRDPSRSRMVRAGDLTIDTGTRDVTVGGRAISLSAREFDLLVYLAVNADQVLPRQRILDEVWGFNFFGDENNVEVYVRYLRQKLDDLQHERIQTVRGMGYRLRSLTTAANLEG